MQNMMSNPVSIEPRTSLPQILSENLEQSRVILSQLVEMKKSIMGMETPEECAKSINCLMDMAGSTNEILSDILKNLQQIREVIG
jgi:hypothetical protein